jgi:hypothetical protein
MSKNRRYDFKIYLDEAKKILGFRAFVTDATNYHILKVKHFGIDPVYQNIFLRALKNNLNIDYIENNERKSKNIQNTNPIKNLQELTTCCNNFFGFFATCKPIKMQNMIKFRYEGHDLHIDYGLPVEISNKINSISYKLIDVAANNGNFGEVFRYSAEAGSTIIPFSSERIDEKALNTIKKVMVDIKNRQIDKDFIAQNNSYSKLYKEFIKKLKLIKKIKDLKVFEIIMDDSTYRLDDLKCIDSINNQLYGDKITSEATVRYFAQTLKRKPHIAVLVVDVDGREKRLHIDTKKYSSAYELSKNAQTDTKINFIAQQNSEDTYSIESISVA